jgi:hypothetical protein
VLFRVRAGDEVILAGVYETDAEYNETSVYDPEARISMVMVRLATPESARE